jgi:hypothetical protein
MVVRSDTHLKLYQMTPRALQRNSKRARSGSPALPLPDQSGSVYKLWRMMGIFNGMTCLGFLKARRMFAINSMGHGHKQIRPLKVSVVSWG